LRTAVPRLFWWECGCWGSSHRTERTLEGMFVAHSPWNDGRGRTQPRQSCPLAPAISKTRAIARYVSELNAFDNTIWPRGLAVMLFTSVCSHWTSYSPHESTNVVGYAYLFVCLFTSEAVCTLAMSEMIDVREDCVRCDWCGSS
jgi:hypothetical protein